MIVPEEVDTDFLKKFKLLIEKYLRKNKRFVLITGGGKTCRKYQAAAKSVTELSKEQLDWLGIYVTRLNGDLMRLVLHEYAHQKTIDNPTEKIDFKEGVLVGAGWKPGCSTDHDAILLAKNIGAKKLVNLSNIDYVYDKDPKKYNDAKPITDISWTEFRKLLPEEWDPGLNSPFDPVASREAQKLGIEVVILNGKNLENIENYLEGKAFIGTKIHA